MGSVIWLFIVMLVIASLAFAPLGYFIYMYSMKQGEPFGKTEPHGDSDSALLNAVEKVINTIKQRLKI